MTSVETARNFGVCVWQSPTSSSQRPTSGSHEKHSCARPAAFWLGLHVISSGNFISSNNDGEEDFFLEMWLFALTFMDRQVPEKPNDLTEAGLPPLLKEVSWTKAAPFKESKYYRSTADSIGNNYSPSAAFLNVKSLVKSNTSPVKDIKGTEKQPSSVKKK